MKCSIVVQYLGALNVSVNIDVQNAKAVLVSTSDSELICRNTEDSRDGRQV
jgi:hypothetical protein